MVLKLYEKGSNRFILAASAVVLVIGEVEVQQSISPRVDRR